MSEQETKVAPEAQGLGAERLAEIRKRDADYGIITNFSREEIWERHQLLQHITALETRLATLEAAGAAGAGELELCQQALGITTRMVDHYVTAQAATEAERDRVLQALVAAERGLAGCYDVNNYPADGTSDAETALAAVRQVLAQIAATPVAPAPQQQADSEEYTGPKMTRREDGRLEPPCWPCPGCLGKDASECLGLCCIHAEGGGITMDELTRLQNEPL